MEIAQFFDLFLEELRQTDAFDDYYKFHQDDQRFDFRKAYFIQRLQYLKDQIGADVSQSILDVGCGYGTSAIYLALNGYQVEGITLEFYTEHLENRLAYWKQFGDISGFQYSHKDIFEGLSGKYDIIIAQDTLHHLEPLHQALGILADSLSANGKLIAIEENGANIIQNLKLIKQRGFKKVKEVYDERLDKTFLLGDENIRSLSAWEKAMQQAGLKVDPASVAYIRYFLPGHYKGKQMAEVIEQEQRIVKKSTIRKNYFFFGLNFVAEKD